MKLLRELLNEAQEKNLIGLTINGKLITVKTKDKKWTGDFDCSHNELTSLTGAPTSVTGNFYCRGNKLTSLKDVHKQIKSIGGTFYLIKNPIKSHVLGLLKIKRLKYVELDNKEAEKIINKYLPEGDIFDCQEELIEAGLDKYAQL